MSTPAKNVTLHKGQREHEGSCNACARHPLTDPEAPPVIYTLSLGDRSTTTVRLCPDCLEHLRGFIDAVPRPREDFSHWNREAKR